MNKDKILLIFFIFLLPILLLLLSYKITLSVITLTPSQQQTLDFLNGKSEVIVDYTSLERAHLDDVKQVRKIIDLLFYLVLLTCSVILTGYKKNQPQLHKLLKYGGIIMLVIIFLILLASSINFTFLFTLFHRLFFPQGNWIFPEDSLLIQTFPFSFFVTFTRLVFIQTFVYSGLLFLLSLLIKKTSSQQY